MCFGVQGCGSGRSSGAIAEHPTGVTIFPKDMVPAPRQFAERFFRIVRWTELRAGGHFTAWEEPEAFARELTARQETWSLRRAMADRY